MMKDERYYQAYLSHQQISRRGLFRGVLGGTQKTLATEQKRTATRPPFACPEHLFTAVCNGCGECISACPNGLISLQGGLATLEIDYLACDFCGLCAKACPKDVLNLAFKADTHLRPEIAAHCVQKKGQPCQSCQQACPQKAISAQLGIDTKKCNGCGECKIACYVAAIGLRVV